MLAAAASYAPSVLLIEDDRPAREYLTRRFYRETSLGVVVARDLVEAKKLIDSSDIHFDAIVSDLFFDFGTDSPDEGLRDGIDILAYGKSKRPVALSYVNSYWADRDEYVDKAQALHIDVRRWFHKQPLAPNDLRSPWAQVERDLISQRLGSRVSDNNGAHTLDQVTEVVRNQLCPIRRTYLQDLGNDDLVIIKPIEVLTWSTDVDEYRASAPCLGLLTDGEGESVQDAIESLRNLICDHKSHLDSESESLGGYAAFVKEQLDQHIRIREGRI
jgi:hypothetical protein